MRLVPRFSMIVPAYNEEALLPRLLDSIDAARAACSAGAAEVEVIVADNASSDATARLSKARGCRVVTIPKRMIAAARNGGAAVAQGDILCFIDADSVIHPRTFDVIEATLASGRYLGGATGVTMERWSLGIVVTWIFVIPLVWLAKMDTGVVFCRSEDFQAVGGYPEDRLFAEDVAFLLRLRRLGRSRGQRLARATAAKAVASARKFDEHGDWHYFAMMARATPSLLRGTKAAPDWALRYWYKPPR
jgi:glycosyltransferase involved in cell wall biosynthesis